MKTDVILWKRISLILHHKKARKSFELRLGVPLTKKEREEKSRTRKGEIHCMWVMCLMKKIKKKDKWYTWEWLAALHTHSGSNWIFIDHVGKWSEKTFFFWGLVNFQMVLFFVSFELTHFHFAPILMNVHRLTLTPLHFHSFDKKC